MSERGHCLDCKWFVNNDGRCGWCHINPPAPSGMVTRIGSMATNQAVFPMVMGSDFCGKFDRAIRDPSEDGFVEVQPPGPFRAGDIIFDGKSPAKEVRLDLVGKGFSTNGSIAKVMRKPTYQMVYGKRPSSFDDIPPELRNDPNSDLGKIEKLMGDFEQAAQTPGLNANSAASSLESLRRLRDIPDSRGWIRRAFDWAKRLARK